VGHRLLLKSHGAEGVRLRFVASPTREPRYQSENEQEERRLILSGECEVAAAEARLWRLQSKAGADGRG
jgi:hypothetical protein